MSIKGQKEVKEGGQEDDWTRVMMTVLGLTVWESGSDVKNRKANKTQESRETTDYRSLLLSLHIRYITALLSVPAETSPVTLQLNLNNLFQLDNLVLNFKV